MQFNQTNNNAGDVVNAGVPPTPKVGVRLVTITTTLLEHLLVSGNKIPGVIVDGLPEGATLVDARVDNNTELLVLKFAHRDWTNTENHAIPKINVQLKTVDES